MNRKSLPIGTDLFRYLRESNAYYIDKTTIIKELVTGGGYVHLFTRPRRYGRDV